MELTLKYGEHTFSLREIYIISKALSIADRVLDAEQDIRFREPSDLDDLRYLAGKEPFLPFVAIEDVNHQHREETRRKLWEEGLLNESV
jgi:hypothetical protein